MPGLNGFQATRAISRDPDTQHDPDHPVHVEEPGDRQDLGHAPGRARLRREAGQPRRAAREDRGDRLTDARPTWPAPPNSTCARSSRSWRPGSRARRPRRSNRRGSGFRAAASSGSSGSRDAGEVIAVPPIAPVPLTQPWFLGVANIRGNLYSVDRFRRVPRARAASAAGRRTTGSCCSDRAPATSTRASSCSACSGCATSPSSRPSAAAAGRAGLVRAALDRRRRRRVAGDRPRAARARRRRSCRSGPRLRSDAPRATIRARRHPWRFKMPTAVRRTEAASSARPTDLDMPTTQVKMAAQNAPGYDPLAPSRSWSSCARRPPTPKVPRKLPLIGRPAGGQAVPGARHAARRCSSCSPRSWCSSTDRAASQAAAADRDGDRDADAVAAPRARLRARVAGPGRRRSRR